MALRKCASCGATIRWVLSHRGSKLPIDAEPVPNGRLVVEAADHHGAVAQPFEPLFDGPDVPRYRSHFTTCPNAEKHSKRRR